MDEMSMKKEVDVKDLVPTLEKKVLQIKRNLEAFCGIDTLGFKISFEAWANDNGVALGAVSCLRKPADEAIELTIDVQQRRETIETWMGIYWSDGRVIAEIAEMEMVEIDAQEAISKFEAFLERNSSKSVEILSHFLLQQKE